ncbi:MAG: hypothetical protein OEY86_00580 [Nitrospira sp.]|nr:hypothetical protein [Nitrospira sp.]
MRIAVIRVVSLILGVAVCAMGMVPAWAGEPAQAGDTKKESAVVKKYPPYPDVWEWVAPFPSRMSHRFQADLLPDGEVQLAYQLKSKTPTPTEDISPRGETLSVLFFGKQAVTPPANIDGPRQKRRARLPNGKIIESHASWSNSDCFSLYRRYFKVRDHKENELAHKILFYVLDHPEIFVPSGMCEGEPYNAPAFSYRMVTMFGDIVPLEDNTFLVVDYEHGVALRFDAQLQSKSPLFNRRIFVMDREDYQSFFRNRKSLTTDADDHDLPHQPVDDDLYQYLKALKEGN